MIKSMTGFGRCEIAEENRKITIEIKTVNHRYLDINLKIPKKFGVFETNIRNLLKEYIQRGKVDLFIAYENYGEENISLKYNENLAKEYLKYFGQMAESFQLENDVTIGMLSRYPEVLTMEHQDDDEEEIWCLIEKALRCAGEQLAMAREKEGTNLLRDLLDKLEKITTYVDFIEERSPEIVQEHREKLQAKVLELLGDKQIDEGRIATEVTVFADKVCVDEEIVRLKSHVQSMKETLLTGGSIGRKLDFITQEMNREANTILSKANDLKISDTGINLKTDIEKVREQIQNIE